MSLPRRQLVRPAPPSDEQVARERLLHRLRGRLQSERASFNHWLSKLKRAFHCVEKIQARLSRIERQLAQLED